MKTYKQSIIVAVASTAQAAKISSVYEGDIWYQDDWDLDSIEIYESDLGDWEIPDIIDFGWTIRELQDEGEECRLSWNDSELLRC